MISEYMRKDPLCWFHTGEHQVHCGDGWIGVLPKDSDKTQLAISPYWRDSLTLLQTMQWAEENNIPYRVCGRDDYPFGRNITIE